MKTIFLAICLFTVLLMQGCGVYVEPVGGYYQRDSFWWFHDGRGREHRDYHNHHMDHGGEHGGEHHEDHGGEHH
ncbi:MAG TPA: hypothetical protein VNZ45_08500 [Bacteroidia bacterium]|jgi:hypothetical protein|nr:hypothetical protein [Bacteroidia bacterium]